MVTKGINQLEIAKDENPKIVSDMTLPNRIPSIRIANFLSSIILEWAKTEIKIIPTKEITLLLEISSNKDMSFPSTDLK